MNTDKLVELFREEVEKLEREAYERGKRDAVKADELKVKFKTAERKAKVGERVLITKAYANDDYVNGDVGTVIKSYDSGGVDIKEWDDYVSYSEYEVIIEEPLSANQQRKELIEQAREFVEKSKNGRGRLTNRLGYRNKYGIICDAEFIVNEEKRTVVVLLKEQMVLRTVTAKGIAKCHPDEVFNADIGKAIALARALEIDVPKGFLNAVQPDGFVTGMIVSPNEYSARKWSAFEISRIIDDELWDDVEDEFSRMYYTKIINDTSAEY